MKIFIAILTLFSLSLNVTSQCGTEVPKSHELNPTYIIESNKDLISYNLDKTLSVYVWIVASGPDNYTWDLPDYQGDFDELNNIFEPINLRFELCVQDSIPNYNYDSLVKDPLPGADESEWDEMRNQHYVPNVINVYYVTTIEGPVAGFANFPGGPDIVVLERGSGVMTLAHEMGHFFGLYHTFETALGLETVDGENCETTGDLVCDTDANFPGAEDEVINGCQYNSLNTDANGQYFTPQMNNIMSYFGDCSNSFTNGQYNRMAFIYLNERNYLW